jgi:transcription-repair coupling factor (superfamily II helicase)
MVCYFIADQKSPFYQSPAFTGVLAWIQQNPGKCRIKEEKDKLSIAFEKVKSVSRARAILMEVNPSHSN